MTIDANGHSLREVRQKLDAAFAESNRLASAPAPAADLESKVAAYVRSIAAPPRVGGIGTGEQLRVDWKQAANGFEHKGRAAYGPGNPDSLGLLAWLVPEKLTAALMAQIELNLPADNPPQAMAKLRTEIAKLERLAGALGDPAAPPECIGGGLKVGAT